MITSRDILVDYLRAHKCDGLCNDACGCSVDNLAPESIDMICQFDCQPAMKVACKPEDCEDCEASCESFEGHCRYIPKEFK